MAAYVLFDTETTGNQEQDRIIQVGAMIVHSKENIEVFDELCFTDVNISIEAMEVAQATYPKVDIHKHRILGNDNFFTCPPSA